MYRRRLHRYQNAGLVNIDPQNTLNGEQVYEAANMLPEAVVSAKAPTFQERLVAIENRQRGQLKEEAGITSNFNDPSLDPNSYYNRRKRKKEVENLSRQVLKKDSGSFDPTTQEGRDNLGFFPVVGEAADAMNMGEALQKRNYLDAAMYGAGFALPFVPGSAVKKVAGPVIEKVKGFGKKVLDKAGLTRQTQRLDLQGRPIIQFNSNNNINRNRQDIEDQISRNEQLSAQEIDRLHMESEMDSGYITPEVHAETDVIADDVYNESRQLRELADQGGIRLDPASDRRSAVPESILRKAPTNSNISSNTEYLSRLERNPQGDFEINRSTTDSYRGGNKTNSSNLFRTQSNVRQFDGPFGKETTRIDNPFSGESMRYQDINLRADARPVTLGEKVEKFKEMPKRLLQNLQDRKLTLQTDLQTGRYSPKTLYRSAQEEGSHAGDVSSTYMKADVHKTNRDPSGKIGAALQAKKIINDVIASPGSRFQERSLSTDSYPLVNNLLTRKSVKDKLDVKFSGEWSALNHMGEKTPYNYKTKSYEPGYATTGEDIVDADGVVKTHGQKATLEMLNESIAGLNKAHGTKIPNAKIVKTEYGDRLYAPTIFADSKITTTGVKGLKEKGVSWAKRNPKNIKRASKTTAGVATVGLGSAAIHRYATRNNDE